MRKFISSIIASALVILFTKGVSKIVAPVEDALKDGSLYVDILLW